MKERKVFFAVEGLHLLLGRNWQISPSVAPLFRGRFAQTAFGISRVGVRPVISLTSLFLFIELRGHNGT
jgi:hypothetical protein